MEPAPASLLRSGLSELGLEVSERQVATLAGLAALVATWSPRVDLTSHRDAAAVARHLVLDALALSTVLPPSASVVDLGSGAGFPAFPLAVLDPSRSFTLVESRERAHHFQRTVVRELALENVVLLHGRAETLDPVRHPLALAQAMGPPARVLSWLKRWTELGGWLGIPCVQPPPAIDAPSGVQAEEPRRYAVPLGGPERSLWLGRRMDP